MNTALSFHHPLRNKLFRDLTDHEDYRGYINPRVDLSEKDEHYQIDAELPGLEKKDIHLSFEGGVLTISGEKVDDKRDEKDTTRHRVERSYGKVVRGIRLGNDVDAENISAEYKHGLLTVKVPKKAEAQPKLIDIK